MVRRRPKTNRYPLPPPGEWAWWQKYRLKAIQKWFDSGLRRNRRARANRRNKIKGWCYIHPITGKNTTTYALTGRRCREQTMKRK